MLQFNHWLYNKPLKKESLLSLLFILFFPFALSAYDWVNEEEGTEFELKLADSQPHCKQSIDDRVLIQRDRIDRE